MIFNKGVMTIKWSKESLQQIVLDVDMLGGFSSVQLFVTLWTVARQAPLSMGFSRPEHWSGLPYTPPGDLPGPGIEPASLRSPALAGRSFTRSATWEAHDHHYQLPLTPNLSLWSLLSIKFLHISHTLVTPHSLFMVV